MNLWTYVRQRTPWVHFVDDKYHDDGDDINKEEEKIKWREIRHKHKTESEFLELFYVQWKIVSIVCWHKNQNQFVATLCVCVYCVHVILSPTRKVERERERGRDHSTYNYKRTPFWPFRYSVISWHRDQSQVIVVFVAVGNDHFHDYYYYCYCYFFGDRSDPMVVGRAVGAASLLLLFFFFLLLLRVDLIFK